MITVSEEERLQILDDIITEIQTTSRECRWYITSENIASLLDISREEFHRVLYGFRKELHYKSGIHGGFNEDDGDAIVSVLGRILRLDDVEGIFTRSGIYFNEETLKSAREFFTNYLYTILSRHETDRELLLLLASSTINFDDAYDSYFDDKVDMDFTIRRCMDEFIELYRIDSSFGAEDYLRNYLTGLIGKNVIKLSRITAEHRERLYFDLYGRVRPRKKTVKKVKRGRVHMLLEFFGLEEGCSEAELKKRYKEMLKEYHPDINRDGLEMTQKIIASYKELITLI